MAGSSKQFVFLPAVNRHTWLLWSKRGNAVRLRAYSAENVAVVKELTVRDAELLLSQPDSKIETNACFNTIRSDKTSFWFQLGSSLNIRDGLVPVVEKDKLQAIFKIQCLRPLIDGEPAQLKAIFQTWMLFFRTVKDKNVAFNTYDHEDTTGRFHSDHGKAWQSQLLESSRKTGVIHSVDTGDQSTDFSLAAMELTLAIPAKDNPFYPRSQSRIAPDGLGVRRNGFLTVVEVKGPSDEKDLLGPLLQATCGALAVVAKQDMLCRVLRNASGRRPGYLNARVPKRRSIGIHVVTAKHKRYGKLEAWSLTHEEMCRRVLRAFPQLEYVAYSFVEPEKTNCFTQLQVDHLVRIK